MRQKFAVKLFCAALCVAMPAAPALASGGGGGGGGSVPSSSGSRYDPVEEYQSGIEKLQAGDYGAAERHFRRVVDVARRDANSHYLLGLSRLGLEKWSKAEDNFERALRYDAEMHDARARLGYVAYKQGDMEIVQEQIAELQTRHEACAGACIDSAKIEAALAGLQQLIAPPAEMETEDTSEDGAEADEASLFRPDTERMTADAGDAAYLDAVRLINLGRYDEAIGELKQAQAVFGPHPDVLTYLGFANRKQGDYVQAISYYSSALDVAPDHLNANEYLGEYYVELGDIHAAQVQLDRLETLCAFGCVQTEELRQWIDAAGT